LQKNLLKQIFRRGAVAEHTQGESENQCSVMVVEAAERGAVAARELPDEFDRFIRRQSAHAPPPIMKAAELPTERMKKSHRPANPFFGATP